MKKALFTIAAVAAVFCCSCTKDLEDRVGDLEKKVDALEAQVKDNVNSIEQLLTAAATTVTVKSVVKTENGYTINFSDGTKAEIANGVNGKDGADGKDGVDGKDAVAPTIGFKEVDGVFCWTVNGELIKNGDANVPVTGKDGVDGKTPQFKIEDGAWKVSFDGETWTDVPVTGKVAPTLEMTETETEYVFTLGESVIKIAKYFEFAIKVESHLVRVEPNSQPVFSYTITGADETVKVIMETDNITAVLDEKAQTVTLQIGATVQTGYVLLKAVRNSDGKYSAQYINVKQEYYGTFGGVIIKDGNEYVEW